MSDDPATRSGTFGVDSRGSNHFVGVQAIPIYAIDLHCGTADRRRQCVKFLHCGHDKGKSMYSSIPEEF